MFIKCLVENTSGGLPTKHGLSFYIETKKHKILFDLGPNDLFYKNAIKCNIDISKVDTVIISHGHFDHGGGLKTFLEHNNSATVYIQESAFEKHYSKALFFNINIGMDESFKNNNQIKLINGNFIIDDELSLFTSNGDKLKSSMNNSLLGSDKFPDKFEHEQSLLIKENKNVLFAGCSHKGIFNIMESINDRYDIIIGGFHLYNPVSGKTESDTFLKEFKDELSKYNQTFYTCHCTGTYAFNYLKQENVKYINCGMELNIR